VSTISNNNNDDDDLESRHIVEASWNKAEQDLLEQRRRDTLMEQIQEEQHPSRKLLHSCMIVVSIVTCIAAALMLIGQVIGLFIFRSYGPIQYVFHFNVFLLCILVVLVEMEFTPVGRQSFIFSYWVTRGLSYEFIGVLGLEENDTADWTNPSDVVENFVKVVAWFMVGCGSIYFVLGLFCIQIIYTRERTNYDERMLRAKQLRESAQARSHSTAP
jgi:hypothetical protein